MKTNKNNTYEMENDYIMSRIYNTFEFVGNLNIPKEEKNFHQVFLKESGGETNILKFAVNESSNNGQFVQLFGYRETKRPNYDLKPLAKGKRDDDGNFIKGGQLEIKYDDRLNEEYVRMVGDFSKTLVDLTTDDDAKQKGNQIRFNIRKLEELNRDLTEKEQEELNKLYVELAETVPDRKEFLHPYDAILFAKENLPKHKDKQFIVKGNINMNEYKGNTRPQFDITSIEIATDERVNSLRATVDLYFAKDAIDEKSGKKEGKVFLNTYVLGRDRNIKEDRFYPFPTVINTSKMDFENPKHLGLFNILKRPFEVSERKEVKHMLVDIKVLRGAEEKPFTIEDLTQTQREYVELGINTLDDFKPKGKLFGESTEEYRISKPLLKEQQGYDFTNGSIVAVGYEPDNLIYTAPEQEEVVEETKVEDKSPKEKPELNNLDEELENLFD